MMNAWTSTTTFQVAKITVIFIILIFISTYIYVKISILSDCSCSEKGSISLICDKETGQCPCQPNVSGRQCETCQDGFKEYPDCERMYFFHINENFYKNIYFCIQLVIVM